MCGRFVLAAALSDLMERFAVDESLLEQVRPSWNVAPTQRVVLIADRDDGRGGSRRVLGPARWGLVPSWAKDPAVGSRMINARSETVLEKPSFRSAAVRRRGIVPMDGYYEWQRHGDGSKTPMYLRPEDGQVLGAAALYEFWKDPALPEDHPEHVRTTTTILTTSATDALGHIHDRTPVVVPSGMLGDWLDPHLQDKAEVRMLLDSMPEPALVPQAVGPEVGNVRNNGPELIEPVPEERSLF